MKQPKISLIVIYNNAVNLKECLESILRQTFTDIEIICVNNASTDNSQEIVQKLSKQDERIKLINLPLENELNIAKQAGLGVSAGEFVCFINGGEILNENYIKEMYFSVLPSEKIEPENNHLYRRAFLENDTDIVQILQEKIKNEALVFTDILNKHKEEVKNEFNKFYQINIETIKNSNYEVTCRFNQLEKLFYEKDYENNKKAEELLAELKNCNQENNKQIYEDISKVYEYINSEINKKGSEINTVYEEISKNYRYTEELAENKKNELSVYINNDKDAIWQKLYDLEKEIIVRYVNIKRVFDSQLDELNLGENSEYTSKLISENFNKIYSHLNNTSTMFYEELSKIYREMNDKLMKKNEKEKSNFENKLSELRNEFDAKIQSLKEELKR